MSTPGLSDKASQAQPADEKSVAPHLRCNSCSKPVFNSYQTPHGCRLCQSCVSSKLHPTEKRQCPGNTEACKDEEEEILISQVSCVPDIATRREISKLVTCPNKDDGCREQVKWRDVDAHLDKCDYEKVSCDQCRDSILKKKLTAHLSDECRQRRVKCDLCSQMVVFSEMDKSHKNLDSATCCTAFQAICPHCKDRSKKFKRPSFVDHLRVCPEKPNDCKYGHLGCDKKARKSELEKHYKDDVDQHLSLMDHKLKQLGSGAVSGAAAGGAFAAAAASAGSADSAQLVEVTRKVNNIHDHFKKLQVNVANWAHSTLEFEQMADKFGGISQMRIFLKNLDDKIRQLDSSSGGDTGRRATDSPGCLGASDSSVVQQRLNEIEFRLLQLENTSYEGFLVWKLSNVSRRRREAVDRSVQSIFSQPFYSRRAGFKFRVRLFLNGNESGEGSHVSVYLVLMQHEFDDIQEWPLRTSVTFKLVNLRSRSDDITKTVRFDSGSQRPSSREDLSVCCGEAKFISIRKLDTDFVKHDFMFLDVEVEPNRRTRQPRNTGSGRIDSIHAWLA